MILHRPCKFGNITGSIDEMKSERKIRVLLAKPGLDGHDRGAKVVAHALKEAGMEVVYTGLHQTVPSIVKQAMQEGVDVIGLSIMSGAHVPICRKLMDMVKKEGLEDVLVVVGGVIPNKDIHMLNDLGVKGIFPGGTRFDEITGFIRENVRH
jgi:methylmalonyl-CoA mutase, C-terminal domain